MLLHEFDADPDEEVQPGSTLLHSTLKNELSYPHMAQVRGIQAFVHQLFAIACTVFRVHDIASKVKLAFARSPLAYLE